MHERSIETELVDIKINKLKIFCLSKREGKTGELILTSNIFSLML